MKISFQIAIYVTYYKSIRLYKNRSKYACKYRKEYFCVCYSGNNPARGVAVSLKKKNAGHEVPYF